MHSNLVCVPLVLTWGNQLLRYTGLPQGRLGEATNLTLDLRENYGIFCSIVVYPVVPKDTIMLRLIPTAVHTLDDVQYTIETFSAVKDKLFAGEYKSEKIASWA